MKKMVKVLIVVLAVVLTLSSVATVAFVIGSEHGEKKKEATETTTIQNVSETTTAQQRPQVEETTRAEPTTTETTTVPELEEMQAYLFYYVDGELKRQEIKFSESLESAEVINIPEPADRKESGDTFTVKPEIRIYGISEKAKVKVIYESIETKATNATPKLNDGVTSFWYFGPKLSGDEGVYAFKITISIDGNETVKYLKLMP